MTSKSVYDRIKESKDWQPAKAWHKITTIDMHTEGEPLRVVIDGFPPIQGNTLLECRQYVKNNYDHLRKAIMFEPRGHADMYGCLLLPPFHPKADFSVLFMHNEGYSTMCGHAVIALTKLAIELGWVDNNENTGTVSINIEAPCGLIKAFANMKDREVLNCGFLGVPSFIIKKGLQIYTKNYNYIELDIAYGGAFYAFVDADILNLKLNASNYSEIIKVGKEIKSAIIKAKIPIEHPFESDLSFLYGVIFLGAPESESAHSRNVCVFADGEVDRSPTGSGVSARMALHYFKRQLKMNESVEIESILGTTFTARPIKKTTYGPHEAVIPEVWGTAHITGKNELLIDPNDPLSEGFILR